MGTHASAYLLYGYDLNGADDEWRVQEADEWGYLDADQQERLFAREWLDDGEHDLTDALAAHLLLVLPGAEENKVAERDGEWNRLLKDCAGIWFTEYGHHEHRQVALVAAELRGDCYEPKMITDFAADATPPLNSEEADRDFAWAVGVLAGLWFTPSQEEPRWMLCASYT